MRSARAIDPLWRAPSSSPPVLRSTRWGGGGRPSPFSPACPLSPISACLSRLLSVSNVFSLSLSHYFSAVSLAPQSVSLLLYIALAPCAPSPLTGPRVIIVSRGAHIIAVLAAARDTCEAAARRLSCIVGRPTHRCCAAGRFTKAVCATAFLYLLFCYFFFFFALLLKAKVGRVRQINFSHSPAISEAILFYQTSLYCNLCSLCILWRDASPTTFVLSEK